MGDKCAFCHQEIIGKITVALGKRWHPEHFTCGECKKPIVGGKFNTHEGVPFCEDDYARLFLERCAVCNQPVKETFVEALGKFWHKDHFACQKCGKNLSGSKFMEKDGNPYCEKDYLEMFGEKCFACQKPITDGALVALGNHWHNKCFVCMKCGGPIKESKFRVVDNKPLCLHCS